MTKMSDNGLELTKSFEGLRLEAYLDGGGVPTIGYGHTKGVRMGTKITMEQAVQFLRDDIREAEVAVGQYSHLPLNQNQFDALVDFVFNLGVGAYARSTLLAKLNAGDFVGAGAEFVRWNKDNGKVVDGLTRRRKAETELFSK